VIDDDGRVVNPKFRAYHLPSFAGYPRTEVFFADTVDSIGPMGAKSMSGKPLQPGGGRARPTRSPMPRESASRRLPFKPDRLWPLLQEKFGPT